MGWIKDAAVRREAHRLADLDAQIIGSGQAGGIFGGSAGSGRRSMPALLTLYRTHLWMRLAGKLVGAREAEAEWFLTRPSGRGGRKAVDRVASAKEWDRARVTKAAIDAGDLVEVFKHPFLDMKRRGVPEAPLGMNLSGAQVDHLETVCLKLGGDFFYVLNRDASGMPVRWWPVPPTWMRLPTTTSPVFEIVRGAGVKIPVADVAYFRNPVPDNFYGPGSGDGTALDHDIQVDEHAAEYVASLYRHSAIPRVLIAASNLGDGQKEALELEWRQANQGPPRAGMAHFLGYSLGGAGQARGGVEVHQLSSSPADLKITEQRSWIRDTALQVMGVPQEVAGIVDSGSSRASITQAEKHFRKNTILPDLNAARSFYQNRFFEPLGVGKRPEYDGGWQLHFRLPPLRDAEADAAHMVAVPWAFTHDELREAAGRGPVDGGEERYGVPDGVTITSDLDGMPDPFATIPP